MTVVPQPWMEGFETYGHLDLVDIKLIIILKKNERRYINKNLTNKVIIRSLGRRGYHISLGNGRAIGVEDATVGAGENVGMLAEKTIPGSGHTSPEFTIKLVDGLNSKFIRY